MYVHIYSFIYTHIYIACTRDGKHVEGAEDGTIRSRCSLVLSLSICVCVCVCMYIYIH